ncbi:MAG: hypothetical protein Q9170_000638 [Blastenia crenularia]
MQIHSPWWDLSWEPIKPRQHIGSNANQEGETSIYYTMSFNTVTGTIGCSLGGTTTAVCTATGAGVGDDNEASATGTSEEEEPAATSAGVAGTEVFTTTLGPESIQFTQIPITGAMPTAAPSATSTAASKKSSATTRSTTASGGSPTGQAAATPSGTTGGAAGLESRSIIALVGAAAMAAVML